MKVLNEFPTHHYMEEFEMCGLSCPNCGIRSVWQEQSPGDYYLGEQFICTSCSHTFTIQGPRQMSDKNDLRKIEQLKNEVTFEPTTPRGH